MTTTRIRYRIRPGSDANRISMGGNPTLTIDAGLDYEETSWEQIRRIAYHPEIEYEIVDQRPR